MGVIWISWGALSLVAVEAEGDLSDDTFPLGVATPASVLVVVLSFGVWLRIREILGVGEPGPYGDDEILVILCLLGTDEDPGAGCLIDASRFLGGPDFVGVLLLRTRGVGIFCSE